MLPAPVSFLDPHPSNPTTQCLGCATQSWKNFVGFHSSECEADSTWLIRAAELQPAPADPSVSEALLQN